MGIAMYFKYTSIGIKLRLQRVQRFAVHRTSDEPTVSIIVPGKKIDGKCYRLLIVLPSRGGFIN